MGKKLSAGKVNTGLSIWLLSHFAAPFALKVLACDSVTQTLKRVVGSRELLKGFLPAPSRLPPARVRIKQ